MGGWWEDFNFRLYVVFFFVDSNLCSHTRRRFDIIIKDSVAIVPVALKKATVTLRIIMDMIEIR